MKNLLETNLLFAIFPELVGLDNVRQDPRFHPEGDVLKHTLLVAEHVPAGMEFFFAAILHDVGKKETTVVHEDGRISAHGHEDVSAEVAELVMDRLKVSTELKNEVVFLVRHHMKAHSESTQKKTLRRLINEGGVALVEKLVAFGFADVAAGSKDFAPVERVKALFEEIKNAPVPVVVRPVLNGGEVMAMRGLRPGPDVGRVLAALVDFQMERDNNVSREEAERFVMEFVL